MAPWLDTILFWKIHIEISLKIYISLSWIIHSQSVSVLHTINVPIKIRSKEKFKNRNQKKNRTIYFSITSLFISFSRKFFEPDFEKMKEITVWRKAAEQMFFSLSVSWGGLIMFGSYNKFRHKVHYPALIISSLDFLTSIIAGVVVFSILGHLKFKGKEVYKALMPYMAIPVVEFSREGYKIRKVFG